MRLARERSPVRCTSNMSAFWLMSATPSDNPISANAPNRASTDGATPTVIVATANATAVVVAARAVPRRRVTSGASIDPSTPPTPVPSSANPRVASVAPTASRISGNRGHSEGWERPLARNSRATPWAGRRREVTGRLGRSGGPVSWRGA
jgi:hypothetical protein